MGSTLKKVLAVVFFLAVMLLSFYTVFNGQDINVIFNSILDIPFIFILICMLLSLGYVTSEGMMIAFLMGGLEKRRGLLQYIKYSYIGFFYCAITPSASGGQPMQLVHMKRDGSKFNSSFVVLMVIALLNKLILTLIGVALLIFCDDLLGQYLRGYHTLFYIGLGIDFAWVLILLFLVLFPGGIEKLFTGIVKLIFGKKPEKFEKCREGIVDFFKGYREAVVFLRNNKSKVGIVAMFSFLQRISLFFITYFVYLGLGLSGTSMMTILIVQAAIYVTVDMLPIPGAQGITELMYKESFAGIFTASTIMPSVYVTRGVYFYFLLLICGGVVLAQYIKDRIKKKKARME